ncbi:hypothetical protein CI109_103301 [Kwoniella shandongensis]|uniref:Uncharacterized protein n=1 Tax=Kwoniella shandongensis TaxID=1734106 RepID=A0A5M6BRQ5_9TREE|nr:uncharacterized protein CI109_006027 [Kwoniella shandongensis]KAA5525576.1 hypothetical protein CI109_006027 [Kwoniella shandongensis]
MSSPNTTLSQVSSLTSSWDGAAAATATVSMQVMAATTKLHDRSGAIFTVTLVTMILAVAFTVMRLISKGWIVRKVTLDDWFAVLGCLFSLVVSISIMVGAKNGLGKQDAAITPDMYGIMKRSTFILTVFYSPALMATKTAILILYIRMSAAHPILRYCSIANMVVVNLAGAVSTLIIIFQCRPVHAAWSVQTGQCIDVVTVYLSSAPINILTDLAILLLPLPILTGLRMERRTKIVLVTTFIVGGFVTIVDVIRIAYLQNALKIEGVDISSSPVTSHIRPVNFSYSVSFSLMWSAVEVSVGLMCCCVLVLKPLVMRIMPAMLRESSPIAPHTVQLESLPPSDMTKSPKSPVELLRTVREVSDASDGVGDNVNDGDGEDARQPEQRERMVDFFQMLESGPGDQTASIHTVQPRSSKAAVPKKPLSAVRSAPAPQSSLAPGGAAIERKSSYRALSDSLTRFRSKRSASKDNQAPTNTFFDFVNMSSRKPLTELTAREAWGPVLFTSTLFFLWGFAYGLLGTLNAVISSMLGFSANKDLAQHDSYWIAYFVGPACVGYWTLTRGGFKITFITGLSMLSAGAMAFWPSAVLSSYPGFVISNFMIASGLSVLETAANPFIALAGPGEYSEARLNFSQGIQAIGGFLSSLLANKVLFKDVTGRQLYKVQWCYLAVAIFVLFVAIIFFYFPLCEVDDEHLELKAQQRFDNAGISPTSHTFGTPTRYLLAATGVLAMSFYVGAQESVSYYWGPVSSEIHRSFDPFWGHEIGRAVFALGRFIASALCFLGLPPRIVLAVYVIGAFITTLLTMILPAGNGTLAVMIMIMFFQSAIFPTLFAIIIRGQGRNTKLVSTLTVMSICGGAVWPTSAFGVRKARPDDPRMVLIIPVVLTAVMILHPAMLTAVRELRHWVDPKWSREQNDGDQVNGERRGTANSGEAGWMNKGTILKDENEVGLNSGLGMVGLGVSLNGGNLNELTSFDERAEKGGDHG